MAQFDAGSIIATLDLDRTPFEEGLRLSERQAEDFENRRYNATVGVDDDEARRQLAEIDAENGNSRSTIDVGVDDAEAQTKLAELDAELDRDTRDRTVTIKVKTEGTGQARETLGRFTGGAGGGSGGGDDDPFVKENNDANNFKRTVDSLAGTSFPSLLAVAAGLSPALVPLGAVGGAGALALAGGLAQAVVAIGPFAAVAKSAFSSMQTDTANLAAAQEKLETAKTTQEKAAALVQLAAAQKALTGPVGQAAAAYTKMGTAWQTVVKNSSPAVYKVMTDAFSLAAKLLPVITPLVILTANALDGAVKQLGTALGGSGLRDFLTMVGTDVGPDIASIVKGLIGLGTGLANIFEAINPLTQTLVADIGNLGVSFGKWGQSLNSGGIQGFLNYVTQNGPLVSQFFGALAGALGEVVKAIAPLGGPILTVLTNGLKDLAGTAQFLAPFIKDVAAFMSWGPIPKVLGAMALTLLPLIGAFKGLKAVMGFAQSVKEMGIALGILEGGEDSAAAGALLFDIATAPLSLTILEVTAAVAALAFGVYELVKHWSTVETFFKTLWDHVWSFFHGTIGTILLLLVPFIGLPVIIAEHWGAIEGFFVGLWNTVYGFFKKYGIDILAVIAPFIGLPIVIYQHWSQIVGWLSGIWSHVWGDVTHWWGVIVGWIEGIPGKIEGVFTGAINWLFNAGHDIMQGLKNGIDSMAGSIGKSLLGPLGKFSKYLPGSPVQAGPLRVLNNGYAGRQIIKMIADGITSGEGDLTNAMMRASSLVSNTSLQPKVGSITPASVLTGQQATNTLAQQANTQAAAMLAELTALRKDVQAVPAATGDAVGSTVGNVPSALEKQTKKFVTAGRQS